MKVKKRHPRVPLILQDLKLQSEDGATRCFASFQGTMCFLHLCQGKSLVNVNFDFATLHHRKQIIGHGLRAFARGDVAEQSLARDIQRALGSQHAWCEGCHGTRGIAKTCHQAQGAQAFK